MLYSKHIYMAFHSNLETDYDPDYSDSKLKMQHLLSGKSQRVNDYLFGKLMKQRLFCYFIAKPKNEVYFWFLALEGESKLIHITNSKNSNRNLFGLIASILCQQYFISLITGWTIYTEKI